MQDDRHQLLGAGIELRRDESAALHVRAALKASRTLWGTFDIDTGLSVVAKPAENAAEAIDE